MTQNSGEMRSESIKDILSDKDILGFVFIAVIDCASLCTTGGTGRSPSCAWLELWARRDPPGADALC